MRCRLDPSDGRDPFRVQGSWGPGGRPDLWRPVAIAPPSDAFHRTGVIETALSGWFSLADYEETEDTLEFSFVWDRSTGPPPWTWICESSRWPPTDELYRPTSG